MCCPASARPRWSIAPAEARRERGGEGVDTAAAVAIVVGSGRVVDDGRCFRHPDRIFTAVVDDAGRDFRGGHTGFDGAVPRRQGLPAIAEAPGMRPADRVLCAGGGWNAVVERAME